MALSAGGRMALVVVKVKPLDQTLTPNSACVWLAEAWVGGRHFEARSRHGALNALARELVAAGIADRPLEVHFEGLAGCLRWGSFAAAATRTYTEGNRLLQCIRWVGPQDAVQTIRAPPKQRVEELAGTVVCPPDPGPRQRRPPDALPVKQRRADRPLQQPALRTLNPRVTGTGMHVTRC
jgi:hypothetical protein